MVAPTDHGVRSPCSETGSGTRAPTRSTTKVRGDGTRPSRAGVELPRSASPTSSPSSRPQADRAAHRTGTASGPGSARSAACLRSPAHAARLPRSAGSSVCRRDHRQVDRARGHRVLRSSHAASNRRASDRRAGPTRSAVSFGHLASTTRPRARSRKARRPFAATHRRAARGGASCIDRIARWPPSRPAGPSAARRFRPARAGRGPGPPSTESAPSVHPRRGTRHRGQPLSSSCSRPALNSRSYSRYNNPVVIGTDLYSMSMPWGGGGRPPLHTSSRHDATRRDRCNASVSP